MRKDFIQISVMLLTFIMTFSVVTTIQAQEVGMNEAITSFNDNYLPDSYPSGNYDGYNADAVSSDNMMDYHYDGLYYYNRRNRSNTGFNGYIQFGRKFDNSDNFTTGVSSYQGTSTGPGPNGGYPGAPKGNYQTNYIDNSLYPNTYNQHFYSR